MNARKTILVLGSVALVIVGALIAFAIFAHAKFEKESNRERTAKAREARHKRPDQQSQQQQQIEADEEVEEESNDQKKIETEA